MASTLLLQSGSSGSPAETGPGTKTKAARTETINQPERAENTKPSSGFSQVIAFDKPGLGLPDVDRTPHRVVVHWWASPQFKGAKPDPLVRRHARRPPDGHPEAACKAL